MHDNDIIDFSKMPCKYWSESTKVSHLQRRVLLYSIMYYQLDESCIEDYEYDAVVKQLLRMQKRMKPDEFKKTTYYYAMHDFEGSTGFYLFSRLNKNDRKYLLDLAKDILDRWRETL